jgi:hypothetical protein
LNSDHAQPGARGNFALAQGTPGKRFRHQHAEQFESLAENQQLPAVELSENLLRSQRSVADREVGAGAINRLDIFFVGDAADNAQAGITVTTNPVPTP